MTEYLLPSSGTTTSSGLVLASGDSLTVMSGGTAVGTVDSGSELATGGGVLDGGSSRPLAPQSLRPVELPVKRRSPARKTWSLAARQ